MRVSVAVVVAVVGVAACGSPAARPPPVAPAPAPAPAPVELEPVCGHYVYQILLDATHSESDGATMVTAYDDVNAIAHHDYDAAVAADAAGHPRDAARHFLDCAHRYASVPAGDPLVDTAVYDAHVCYYDAIYAFGNASRFEAEGRAALEAAATADPRNADYIHHELATPPSDCGSSP